MCWKIFKPNLKLIVFAIILYIINIIIILQLIPVFESQDIGAKFVNLLAFPPNFMFEDLLGITSLKTTDVLTWLLQFLYDYIIIAVIVFILKGGSSRK